MQAECPANLFEDRTDAGPAIVGRLACRFLCAGITISIITLRHVSILQGNTSIMLRSAVPLDVYSSKRRQVTLCVHVQPVQGCIGSHTAHAGLDLRVVFVPDGSVRSTEDC